MTVTSIIHLTSKVHAIIINNIASSCPESIKDVEALSKAYQTVGFDVQVHNDCAESVSST